MIPQTSTTIWPRPAPDVYKLERVMFVRLLIDDSELVIARTDEDNLLTPRREIVNEVVVDEAEKEILNARLLS